MVDNTFEKEIRKTFLDETDEMLNESEKLFLQLESDRNINSRMPKILRIMHTIKGSSAVVELFELNNFMHKFESILIAIKDGVIELNSYILNLIFVALDTIKLYLKQVRNNDVSLNLFFDMSNKIDLLINEKLNTYSLVDESKTDSSVVENNELNNNSKINNLNKGTILICDDDNDVLNLLEKMIKKNQYNVIKCLKPLDAIEKVKSHLIDVIITDLKMPQLDGHQFSLEIRKLNQYIPIVLISGDISKEDALKFIEVGVVSFINKPFKSKNINSVLERCIRIKNVWEEIIKLSKTSFKIYVILKNIFEKYENDEDILKMQEYLEIMQNSTSKLLQYEKWFKERYAKAK